MPPKRRGQRKRSSPQRGRPAAAGSSSAAPAVAPLDLSGATRVAEHLHGDALSASPSGRILTDNVSPLLRPLVSPGPQMAALPLALLSPASPTADDTDKHAPETSFSSPRQLNRAAEEAKMRAAAAKAAVLSDKELRQEAQREKFRVAVSTGVSPARTRPSSGTLQTAMQQASRFADQPRETAHAEVDDILALALGPTPMEVLRSNVAAAPDLHPKPAPSPMIPGRAQTASQKRATSASVFDQRHKQLMRMRLSEISSASAVASSQFMDTSAAVSEGGPARPAKLPVSAVLMQNKRDLHHAFRKPKAIVSGALEDYETPRGMGKADEESVASPVAVRTPTTGLSAAAFAALDPSSSEDEKEKDEPPVLDATVASQPEVVSAAEEPASATQEAANEFTPARRPRSAAAASPHRYADMSASNEEPASKLQRPSTAQPTFAITIDTPNDKGADGRPRSALTRRLPASTQYLEKVRIPALNSLNPAGDETLDDMDALRDELLAQAAASAVSRPTQGAFLRPQSAATTASVASYKTADNCAAHFDDIETSVLQNVPPSGFYPSFAPAWESTNGRYGAFASALGSKAGRRESVMELVEATADVRVDALGDSMLDQTMSLKFQTQIEELIELSAPPQAGRHGARKGRRKSSNADELNLAALEAMDSAGNIGIEERTGKLRKIYDGITAVKKAPFLAELSVDPPALPFHVPVTWFGEAVPAAAVHGPQMKELLAQHYKLAPGEAVSVDIFVHRDAFFLAIRCEEAQLAGLKVFHALLKAVNQDRIVPGVTRAKIVKDLNQDRMLHEDPRLVNVEEEADFPIDHAWEKRKLEKEKRERNARRRQSQFHRLGDASPPQSRGRRSTRIRRNSSRSRSGGEGSDSSLDFSATDYDEDSDEASSGTNSTARSRSLSMSARSSKPVSQHASPKGDRNNNKNLMINRMSLSGKSPRRRTITRRPTTVGRTNRIGSVASSGGDDDTFNFNVGVRKSTIHTTVAAGITSRSDSLVDPPPPEQTEEEKQERMVNSRLRKFIKSKVMLGLAFQANMDRADKKEESFVAWRAKRTNLRQHAIIVANEQFAHDPQIPPSDMVHRDAMRIGEALKKIGYGVDVVHDRQPEAFLKPTTRNVNRLIRALLDNVESPESSIVVVYLSRGAVAKLGKQVRTPMAFTEKSVLKHLIEPSGVVTPDGLVQFEDRYGNRPLVMMDTYPVPHAPNFLGDMGACCAFGSITARETAGSNIVATYPKNAGGMLTYYFLRALEGFAIQPNFDTQNASLTITDLASYLIPRLERRRCTVSHNLHTSQVVNYHRYFFFANLMKAPKPAEAPSPGPASDSGGDPLQPGSPTRSAGSPRSNVGDFQANIKDRERYEMVRCNCRMQVRLGDDVKPVKYSGNCSKFLSVMHQALKKTLSTINMENANADLTGSFSSDQGSNPGSRRGSLIRRKSSITPKGLEGRRRASTTVQSPRSPLTLSRRATSVLPAPPPPKIAVWKQRSDALHLEFRDAAEIIADPSRMASLSKELQALLKNALGVFTLEAEVEKRPKPKIGYSSTLGTGRVVIEVQRQEENDWIAEKLLARATSKNSKRIIRRPRAVFVDVDCSIVCTRREARKLDRVARLQSIFALATIEYVEVDPHPPRMHSLLTKVQAAVRGMMQLKRYTRERTFLRDEELSRTALEMSRDEWMKEVWTKRDEDQQWCLGAHEYRERREFRLEETGDWYDIIRIAVGQHRTRERLVREQIIILEYVEFEPIIEMMHRHQLLKERNVEFQFLRESQRMQSQEIWERFWLQLEWYKSCLEVRNEMRTKSSLYFRMKLMRPEPPSKNYDIGLELGGVMSDEDDSPVLRHRSSSPLFEAQAANVSPGRRSITSRSSFRSEDDEQRNPAFTYSPTEALLPPAMATVVRVGSSGTFSRDSSPTDRLPISLPLSPPAAARSPVSPAAPAIEASNSNSSFHRSPSLHATSPTLVSSPRNVSFAMPSPAGRSPGRSPATRSKSLKGTNPLKK